MRANNVITLYERLKGINIILSDEEMKTIFSLSNDVVEKILEIQDLSCWEYISKIIFKQELRGDLGIIIGVIKKTKSKTIIREVCKVACDDYVIKSGHLLKLIKIVANTKNEKGALFVTAIACNKDLISLGFVLDYASIVSKSEGIEQADIAFRILKHYGIYDDEERLKLGKLFASAENVECIECVYDAINYESVINSSYSFEIADILLKSSGPNQCYHAALTMRSLIKKDNITVGQMFKLIEIVSKAVDRVRAMYASEIIVKKIEEYDINELLKAVKKVANEKDVKKSKLLYELYISGIDFSECEKLIKTLKKDINELNIPAAVGLMLSNIFECENIYDGIRDVLEDENRYVDFESAYKDSKDDAVNGLKEIENKFPYVDYDNNMSNCYVKLNKPKKESK